jgi:hypothetical protein
LDLNVLVREPTERTVLLDLNVLVREPVVLLHDDQVVPFAKFLDWKQYRWYVSPFLDTPTPLGVQLVHVGKLDSTDGRVWAVKVHQGGRVRVLAQREFGSRNIPHSVMKDRSYRNDIVRVEQQQGVVVAGLRGQE